MALLSASTSATGTESAESVAAWSDRMSAPSWIPLVLFAHRRLLVQPPQPHRRPRLPRTRCAGHGAALAPAPGRDLVVGSATPRVTSWRRSQRSASRSRGTGTATSGRPARTSTRRFWLGHLTPPLPPTPQPGPRPRNPATSPVDKGRWLQLAVHQPQPQPQPHRQRPLPPRRSGSARL